MLLFSCVLSVVLIFANSKFIINLVRTKSIIRTFFGF